MNVTRRDFGRLAAAGLCTAAVSPRSLFGQGKPNSKVNGVQIGVISYSYRQMKPFDALSVLKYAVEDGINATELENVQEDWAGRPMMTSPAAGADRKAAMLAHAEEVTKWRTTMDVNKYAELRKLYNDAGVSIYAFKITLTDRMPDAEFDYAFKAAKLCGANHLTMEMPDNNPGLTARIGKFGEKYKMRMGYHAHTQAKPDTWDEAMAQSPWNCINLDIGHYTAAGNHDQLEFIRKNHARITSMHLKDRQYPEKGGKNQPFGQGDTPIKEVLQLMKKQKYNFPATIELEYTLPEGSDAVKEVAKCYAYAKSALV
ncbi:MAG: sugar phosphate isomerase/epimerase [Terriglobus sp.]